MNYPRTFQLPASDYWDVQEQGHCGQCLAISSVGAMQSRLQKIGGSIFKDVRLSIVKLQACYWKSNFTDELYNLPERQRQDYTINLENIGTQDIQCADGLRESEAMRYWYRFGVPLDSCVPMDSVEAKCGECSKKCTKEKGEALGGFSISCRCLIGEEFNNCSSKGSKEGLLNFNACAVYKVLNPTDVKMELSVFGPLICILEHGKEFPFWSGTSAWVEQVDETEITGTHAMLVVGWRTTSEGNLQWRIQNSWGSQFGPEDDRGHGYIDNTCRIRFCAMIPDIGRMKEHPHVRSTKASSYLLKRDNDLVKHFRSKIFIGYPKTSENDLKEGVKKFEKLQGKYISSLHDLKIENVFLNNIIDHVNRERRNNNIILLSLLPIFFVLVLVVVPLIFRKRREV